MCDRSNSEPFSLRDKDSRPRVPFWRCFQVRFASVLQPLALTSLLHRGPDAVPFEDYSRWPPRSAVYFGEEREAENTQRIGNKLPKIDFRRRFTNRRLSTETVLEMLYHKTPRFWELAQVAGKWVWIQFDGRQPRQITSTLSEFGFHWNRRRQVWQHPCGTVNASSNREPRRKYRTCFPADMSPV